MPLMQLLLPHSRTPDWKFQNFMFTRQVVDGVKTRNTGGNLFYLKILLNHLGINYANGRESSLSYVHHDLFPKSPQCVSVIRKCEAINRFVSFHHSSTSNEPNGFERPVKEAKCRQKCSKTECFPEPYFTWSVNPLNNRNVFFIRRNPF